LKLAPDRQRSARLSFVQEEGFFSSIYLNECTASPRFNSRFLDSAWIASGLGDGNVMIWEVNAPVHLVNVQ